jgi:hypothetical protein
MEITLFGYIFLFVYVIGLFLPVRYLTSLVIYSCVFQSTAIINISEKGFQPYVVASIFLIVKSFSIQTLLLDIKRDAFVRLIVIFILFSVSVSIILPIIWDGITVYAETNIDLMAELGGEQLHFGIRNITQCCYAIVNLLTIYSIYKNRVKISTNLIVRIFTIAIITVLIIGFWEFTAKTTQIIPFPHLFIYNNIGYSKLYLQTTIDGLMRLNSLFLEPSYCGAFLSASFWAIMSIDSVKSKVLCAFIGLALMLNLSGTGMVSFLAGFILYSYVRRSKILWFAPVLLALALVVSNMGYGGYVSDMLMGKASSTSGIHRSMAAFFTWDLFLYTKGLGVGLGSHRGTSFILDMLVGVGIIGTFLFYKIYSRLLKSAISVQHVWLFMFGIVLFVAQCLAIPDFSFGIMWMCLFMATAVLPQKLCKK